MKEKIILAPGTGDKLLKNLAYHDELKNKQTFNLRIMNAREFASYALMKNGVAVSESILSSDDEVCYISQALDDVDGVKYFENLSISDVENITHAISKMRSFVTAEDESAVIKNSLLNGEFIEKNKALLYVYKNYTTLKRKKNCIDGADLIRKAIQCSKPISAECYALNEYQLSPLEAALLKHVSDSQFKEISIFELYNVKKTSPKIEKYKSCYGHANEVESTIDDIYSNYKLDECCVALTNTKTYSQIFYDYSVLHDIPITFGCGIPIVNSNPAKLLKDYRSWVASGFLKSTFVNLINSEGFDKHHFENLIGIVKEKPRYKKEFYETLINLRLSNDGVDNGHKFDNCIRTLKEEWNIIDTKAQNEDTERLNKFSTSLHRAAEIFTFAKCDFILNLSLMRFCSDRFIKNSDIEAENKHQRVSEELVFELDWSARKYICDELKALREISIDLAGDPIDNILESSVCKQPCEGGKLHITSIRDALVSTRKNLFILGLSGSMFPGSPRENHLLLDSDINAFKNDETTSNVLNRYTSNGCIEEKKRQFFDLISQASSLNNNICVSYPGLNVAELKKENPSSVLFELFSKEIEDKDRLANIKKQVQIAKDNKNDNPSTFDLFHKYIKKVGYFDPCISKSREIGKAYNQGMAITTDSKKTLQENLEISANKDKYWSPSAINKFFEDKQAFVKKYLLGLPDEDQVDDNSVITPLDAGNIAHKLMEILAEERILKDKFIELAEQYFDRHVMKNPPIVESNVEDTKQDFLDMMSKAYDNNPDRKVFLAEEDIKCSHDCGLNIHGLPDRVEELDDGTCVVVDFKTGRKIKHDKDDIDSCLQAVIYAYILEKVKGLKISRCEYRYLRHDKKYSTITCKYDDEMKTKLNEKLTIFKNALDNFDFEPEPEDE